MRRIKLTVEYDGTNYYGWQFQKGQITIQESIERAFKTIFKKHIRVTAAGRTDTGVHARCQVVHADIPGYDLNRLKRSLNGILEKDIRIKTAEPCADDFHARFDATIRRYRYTIALTPAALDRNFVWQIHDRLNLTLMQEGARIIAGTENFQAFCKLKSEVNHYVCRIYESRWFIKDERLIYEIAADRFLHGMVRAIVGSLIDLGRGMFTLGQFREIIASGDRTKIITTAPPTGLVLDYVGYEPINKGTEYEVFY